MADDLPDAFQFSEPVKPVVVACDDKMLCMLLQLLPPSLKPRAIIQRNRTGHLVWDLHFVDLELPPGLYMVVIKAEGPTGRWSFQFKPA